MGEVVFNTAMTGYQEILTDPSYARQIVTLTYPQIGNTGANPEDVESDQVWASGLVIRQLPRLASNWRMTMTLPEYLQSENVVAIADVDTRRLTRLIREKGALAGCIIAGDATEQEAIAAAQAFPGLSGMDLARVVSRAELFHLIKSSSPFPHFILKQVAWACTSVGSELKSSSLCFMNDFFFPFFPRAGITSGSSFMRS